MAFIYAQAGRTDLTFFNTASMISNLCRDVDKVEPMCS